MSETSNQSGGMALKSQVKINGENGYYWIQGVIRNDDGSIDHYELWGGSKDPNGRRRNRAVKPEMVKPDKRKIDAALRPWKD